MFVKVSAYIIKRYNPAWGLGAYTILYISLNYSLLIVTLQR